MNYLFDWDCNNFQTRQHSTYLRTKISNDNYLNQSKECIGFHASCFHLRFFKCELQETSSAKALIMLKQWITIKNFLFLKRKIKAGVTTTLIGNCNQVSSLCPCHCWIPCSSNQCTNTLSLYCFWDVTRFV